MCWHSMSAQGPVTQSMSVVQKVFANENFNPISEAPSRAVLFGGVDVPVYAKPWSTKDNEAKIDVISHKNKKGGAKTDYNVFIIELRFGSELHMRRAINPAEALLNESLDGWISVL